jgi:CRP-like cAMP-binding protein
MASNFQPLLTTDRDSHTSSMASKNELLRQLFDSQSVKDLLMPELKLVTLSPNQVLYEQGDHIDAVYFPLDAVISSLAIMEDGTTVETSMLGRESLVGISSLLGSGSSRQWIWVLLSGTALSIDAKTLERVFVQNETALRAFLGSYRYLVTQVTQRCVCNTRHTILERLCCWLLMIHDRVGGDNLKLTQEMIASRLGARRAGITVAAGMLQEMHAIEYRRGQLHIKDRQVLEHAVCECYNMMRGEFSKVQKNGNDDYATFSL